MNENKLRETLCNILIEVKKYSCLSYDDIVRLSDNYVNKSQLIKILKHDGYGVSPNTIFNLLIKLNIEVEVKGYI